MLQVKDLTYYYPGGSAPALDGVSLHLRPGECVCLTGHSGCGKSTLLMAIKGLLHTGDLSGAISVDTTGDRAADVCEPVGLVFQNAETQILCSTVCEEVAFGPENLCVPVDEIAIRIRNSLAAVGLTGHEQRNVERFSAGQKHRLAIASVLSMHPRLLLLDEPNAQLDGDGKTELAAFLGKLKGEGYTILIAEHNLAPFIALADRFVVMEQGRVVKVSREIPEEFHQPAEPAAMVSTAPVRPDAEKAVMAEGVSIAHPEIGQVMRGVDLSIGRGELVHLYGRNGAGKSSLLRCLAGVVPPESGRITVAGVRNPSSAILLGRVGFLFQNPQRQLFEDTVTDEVAFSLKRLRLTAGQIKEQVAEALKICEAEHLAGRLPLMLSFGEQHRVALASVLAPRPELLLLDEPFAGLDLAQRRRLLAILTGVRDRHGTTVLLASHDPLPNPAWADRVLTMEGGNLV